MTERPFRKVALLDTSIASTNIGDEIIMEAVERQLAPLFSDDYVCRIASHERMSSKSRSMIAACDYAVAGGSNLLSSHAGLRSVWKLSPLDARLGQKFVMMGVGWYHDQASPDPYTAWLFKSIFARDRLHSVRDGYSKRKLEGLGFENVINTGCPTLWELPANICDAIPKIKSGAVVTTVNTYMKDPEADASLLRLLQQNYQRVFAWVQSCADQDYLRSLAPDVELIAPNLAAFDRILTGNADIDYVGNRLHAGIRALQKGRRTIIVEIDNRAREMARDFRLPTVARTDFERLNAMITQPLALRVALPRTEINRWRDQWRRR